MLFESKSNFSGSPYERAALSFVEGIAAGAPDCWPAINRVVNTMRTAANHAVAHAWQVVDQREATLKHTLNQYYATLNTVYYLRNQVGTLGRQVNQLHTHYQQSQQTISQLHQTIGQLRSQVGTLQRGLSQSRTIDNHLRAQLQSNANSYVSAITTRGNELRNERRDLQKCHTTVASFRLDEASCQQQLAHCKTCR